jgi:hypothetical protein
LEVYLEIKKKKLRLKKAVAVVNAVVDASAREVIILLNIMLLLKVRLKVKWEVDVVDVDRVNLAVVLESTLADIAGESLIIYGRH